MCASMKVQSEHEGLGIVHEEPGLHNRKYAYYINKNAYYPEYLAASGEV